MPICRSMARTISETRKIKIQLRGLLSSGADDDTCAETLDIRVDEVRFYKDEILREELASFGDADPHMVFAKYKIRMEGAIGAIDEVIEEARYSRANTSGTVVVNAARAKADIIDKIVTRGQDLGVIHREATKSLVLGGISVVDMSVSQLRGFLAERMKQLGDMIGTHGQDYAVPVDEPVYFEAAPAPKAVVRTKT